jgi:hypothetical protein
MQTHVRNFREQVRRFLYNPIGVWGHIFNAFITLLILFSVALIPLEFIPLFEQHRDELFYFELVVVVVFTIEYLLRAWSAKKFTQYVFSWFGLIDLIAILPFYLQYFDLLGLLGFPPSYLFALRLLRILRLLKLGTLYGWEREAMREICDKYDTDFHPIDDEKITYVVNKHPIVLFFHVFPPIVMLSASVAISLAYWGNTMGMVIAGMFFAGALITFFKAWLDYHYDAIYITTCRIIMQDRHLFGSTISDVIYEAIADIRPLTAGLWRQLFRYGDILIETSADASRTFTNAQHPRKAVHMIAMNRQRAINGPGEDNVALGMHVPQHRKDRKRVAKKQIPQKPNPAKKSEFDFILNRFNKTFSKRKMR